MQAQVNINTLFKMAQNGTLPVGFNQWNLTNEHGWSVAHVAAYCGHLPDDFNQWDLVDNNGTTVAHVATEQCPEEVSDDG
jgi:hypothetical protein